MSDRTNKLNLFITTLHKDNLQKRKAHFTSAMSSYLSKFSATRASIINASAIFALFGDDWLTSLVYYRHSLSSSKKNVDDYVMGVALMPWRPLPMDLNRCVRILLQIECVACGKNILIIVCNCSSVVCLQESVRALISQARPFIIASESD